MAKNNVIRFRTNDSLRDKVLHRAEEEGMTLSGYLEWLVVMDYYRYHPEDRILPNNKPE